MTDSPVPTNPITDVVDKLIQGIVFGMGVNAAIISAVAAMPWLGLPIISTLFSYAVNKVATMIYSVIEPQVAFQIINFQTDAEKTAYDNAVAALTSAHLKGDPTSVQQATIDFKKKLASLVRFDGA